MTRIREKANKIVKLSLDEREFLGDTSSMTIGEQIRRARERAGLNQVELAALLAERGIASRHRQQVWQWEHGRRNPSAETYLRILTLCATMVSEE